MKIDLIKARVQFLLRSNGFSSQKALASKLKISPSALNHNLKRLVENGDFTSRFSASLCNALDISADNLSEQLLGDRKELPWFTGEYISKKIKTLEAHASEYYAEISEVISNLSAGDKYVFIANERPGEYDKPELERAIIQALQRKVKFVFIFPDADDDKFSKDFSKYFRRFDDSWKHLYPSHLDYIKSLASRHEVSEFDAKELMISVMCSDPFLVTPFHRLVLVEQNVNSIKKRYSFFEQTIGSPDSQESFRQWFPCPPSTTERLWEGAARACESKGKKL